MAKIRKILSRIIINYRLVNNKKRLYNLLNEKYDFYQKKVYGFPLSTSDYNQKILKASSFEEGFEIFKQIKKTDAYSYISLMKLTDDTNKLFVIYEQMREVKRINEFFIPHYIIINMFHSFKDLLYLLDKIKSEKLNSLNGTTKRLRKLAIERPKESLEFLFEFYDKMKIYKNPALNQIVLMTVHDTIDFEKYIMPILPFINQFDYLLKLNIIKSCIKLEKYRISIQLINDYLKDFDYYNEMGNCYQTKEPKKALDLYLSSLNYADDAHQILKVHININRLIYENKLHKESIDFIKESHTFLKNSYQYFTRQGNFVFKYLQKYVVLNEIVFLKKDEMVKKLRFLFSKFYISNKGKFEILKELDTDIVKELIE